MNRLNNKQEVQASVATMPGSGYVAGTKKAFTITWTSNNTLKPEFCKSLNSVNPDQAFIGAGGSNFIYGGEWAVIVGGIGNTIGSTASIYYTGRYGFIGSGLLNCIDSGATINSGSYYGFIGSGISNKICTSSCNNSIVGGSSNTISGNYSFIGGGGGYDPSLPTSCGNAIASDWAFIGSGKKNCITSLSNYSIIGGGIFNTINNSLHGFVGAGFANCVGNTAAGSYSALYSTIVGGCTNCIDTGTVTGSGSYFNFIGNGCCNTVSPATCFSSIVGGANHTVSGSYSAILGGSGNQIPAGLQYVGIFRSGVTGTINNALHIENLFLKPGAYCTYPGFPSTYPSGTVYADTLASNTLRIQP